MKVVTQIKYCNNIIKILIKVPTNTTSIPITNTSRTHATNTAPIPATNTSPIPITNTSPIPITNTSPIPITNTAIIPTASRTSSTNTTITKSVSYYNIYKDFNVKKYIEDEKKYIKKMVKYYNQ